MMKILRANIIIQFTLLSSISLYDFFLSFYSSFSFFHPSFLSVSLPLLAFMFFSFLLCSLFYLIPLFLLFVWNGVLLCSQSNPEFIKLMPQQCYTDRHGPHTCFGHGFFTLSVILMSTVLFKFLMWQNLDLRRRRM